MSIGHLKRHDAAIAIVAALLLMVASKVGFAIGFFIGMGVTAANCLLFDCYVDSAMVSFQVVARRPIARVLINIGGFLWAIALCAFSLGVTLAVLHKLAYAGA